MSDRPGSQLAKLTRPYPLAGIHFHCAGLIMYAVVCFLEILDTSALYLFVFIKSLRSVLNLYENLN